MRALVVSTSSMMFPRITWLSLAVWIIVAKQRIHGMDSTFYLVWKAVSTFVLYNTITSISTSTVTPILMVGMGSEDSNGGRHHLDTSVLPDHWTKEHVLRGERDLGHESHHPWCSPEYLRWERRLLPVGSLDCDRETSLWNRLEAQRREKEEKKGMKSEDVCHSAREEKTGELHPSKYEELEWVVDQEIPIHPLCRGM